MDRNYNKPKEINILFADEDITELFSELVESLGVTPIVINSMSQIGENAKIITEPQYLAKFSEEMLSRCLVVGNRRDESSNAAAWLSRPLTEKKIFEAFEKLLV